MKKPNHRTNEEIWENSIETYRRIRKAIGYLAFFLPMALVVFSYIPFFKTEVQASISKYYYTNLRELFTGVLCAVGLFLIRYEGFKDEKKIWRNDDLMTNIAGYMALGIALIPASPDDWAEKIYTFIPINREIMGVIHYVFAAVFFIILAVISICVFPLDHDRKDKPEEKKKNSSDRIFNEKTIYKICGFAMLGMTILIPIFSKSEKFIHSTLCFEAMLLFFFGISWLVKGRALGDKGKIGRMIYRE
jgi:hypothetical protein